MKTTERPRYDSLEDLFDDLVMQLAELVNEGVAGGLSAGEVLDIVSPTLLDDESIGDRALRERVIEEVRKRVLS